jgi:hypothetical protein
MNSTSPFGSLLAVAVAATLASCAKQAPPIPIDADDIAGVVTSANGPEAGVWVIAETSDFETLYMRSVVTDDAGRYVIPDLPAASYRVWVRGYGLKDSEKTPAQLGQQVNLTATAAPDAATAALVYPAIHWYAMMKVPEAGELAGIVPGGLNQYLTTIKNGSCVGCHQLGNLSTRTIPKELGQFANSQEAWLRRLQSGQAGPQMIRSVAGQLGTVPIKYLADWTDRIAAGELPATTPARPQGLERNIVSTVWDWSDEKAYMHDLISTDRRNPTLNAYGRLYGAPELSTDEFPILDPVKNVATVFNAPVRDADTPSESRNPVQQPSAYWGDEVIWDSKANAHNPMIDHKGRVWYTARIRGESNPSFCRKGSSHPSAMLFPTESSGRQLSVYDPQTGKYTFVDTCFSTHHLQFAEDDNHTLWTSGGGPVVGWVNTRLFDETGNAEQAIGWTALVLDTNGNGKRDAYVEPDAPVNPKLDKRINAGFYAVMPNPADGSVWGSAFTYPGSLVRLAPGANPPATAMAEIYNVPLPGFGVRGADIDRNGVVWVSLGSGHLGEFDRRKCKGPLNGPEATGDHCPEGWTFHPLPGPGFSNLPGFSAESSYYTWVDQHNTSGLGANVPVATGNLSDGLHALVNGKFITMRVPYPLGFYAKGLDGRIDDPAAGWKGRGLWTTSGNRTPAHHETGKGSKPLVVHFQVRPDPLAH